MTELELTDEIKDLGVSRVKATKSELCIYNGKKYTKSKFVSTDIGELQNSFENITTQMIKDGHFGDEKVVQKIMILISSLLSRQVEDKVNTTEDKGKDGLKDTELIIKLAKERCKKIFHDQYQTSYAAVIFGDHVESLSLGSKKFKNYLSGTLYDEYGLIAKAESVKDALNILKYEADFKGDMIPLHLRVASDKSNGNILYDLTDKDWNIIRVTPEDWRIEKSPIIFKRYSNQLPQVFPSRKYNKNIFEQFMRLVNVKDEDNKLLLKCYIIALFVPGIQKAIQMLHGDQGAAKTTFQELEKMLVDPSSIRTLAFPRDTNEFIQKLAHNYIAFFDNVSVIKDWVSDILCRAVTGSGFSKRQLYTDDDDIIYNFRRCVGFNGINLGATKADLLDRGLIIQLSKISKIERREEKEIWKEFEEIKPKLLGYIFDVLVKVLTTLDSVKLTELVRMADFARVCETISRCLGNKEMSFIEAYERNIQLQTQQVLESNIVASIIVEFMKDQEEWEGSATELLGLMEPVAEQMRVNTRSIGYPKAPNSLIRKLNEIKPTLEEIGILITRELDSETKIKTIKICKISLPSLPSLPYKKDAQITRDFGNDISSDILDSPNLSLPKKKQNHTQIEPGNGINGSNDIILTSGVKQLKHKRYWFSKSGNWHCRNCKVSGDKFHMENTNCRGSKK